MGKDRKYADGRGCMPRFPMLHAAIVIQLLDGTAAGVHEMVELILELVGIYKTNNQ